MDQQKKRKEKGTNMAWKWVENFGNSNERVYRCEAFKDDREMIKKAQNHSFQLSDIPGDGRAALASETRLVLNEFKDWAQLRNVSVYKESVYISVRIEKVWMLSNREDWNWKSKGGGGKTVTYTCPGWRCTEEILTKIRSGTISTKDIPAAARDRLASIVELDKNEIGQWGRLTMTADNSRGISVSIETPNIWITANITKSDWSLTGPPAALGGAVGGRYYDYMPSGKFKTYCKDFQSLLNELKNNKGKIWGFILFAHGHPVGIISETTKSRQVNFQPELITAVAEHGYKFAEIHLMQCYSGYKGVIKRNSKALEKILTDPIQKQHLSNIFGDAYWGLEAAKDDGTKDSVKKLLKKQLIKLFANDQDHRYASCEVTEENDSNGEKSYHFSIRLIIDWEARWSSYAVKLETFQFLNIALIDFEPIGFRYDPME